MTPLPKRRWSTHRQGRKRATLKARNNSSSVCPNCGQPKTVHAVCPHCGFYRGKQVIEIKERKEKSENKK